MILEQGYVGGLVTDCDGFSEGTRLGVRFPGDPCNPIFGTAPNGDYLELFLHSISVRMRKGETDIRVFFRAKDGEHYQTDSLPAVLAGDPFSGNDFSMVVNDPSVPVIKEHQPGRGSVGAVIAFGVVRYLVAD